MPAALEPALPAPALRGSRVAFFGGSFDPPHSGHLAIARAAQSALALDTVLFAPVGAQPLKPAGSTASFRDRVAMTQLAIAGEPSFQLSLADAPTASGKPNYTIETLQSLRSQLSPEGALFCLMGADSFLGLRRWHRGAEIPFIAPLIVASRPGQSLADLAAILPSGLAIDSTSQAPAPAVELRTYTVRNGAGDSAAFYLLADLQIDISASAIRNQIRAALLDPASSTPIQVPAAVFDYIAEHGLYR